MNKWLIRYKRLVKGSVYSGQLRKVGELNYWQDQLFLSFLLYCLPVSFIAVIPGIFIAVKDNYPAIAMVDTISLLLVMLVTFANKWPLKNRKIIVVGVFYILSIFLIYNLGYIGPGIFYLFAITCLIALVFPITLAYYSILVNTGLLLLFALIIQFKLFNCVLAVEYSVGGWIAFSSNLVFVSIVVVVLIHKIFERFQLTIKNKDKLKERYKNIFEHSPLPMWLFDTETLQFLDINEAAIRNYGYSREEFLSMTIRDIRPPEKVSEVESIVKENKISKNFYDGRSQHVKKDGGYIYVRIESNTIDVNAHPARLVLATDITNQLKNEQEILNANLKIKESESNLLAIFESAIDGFILFDTASIIKVFNSKAREYIKLNVAETEFETGKSIFNFVETSRRPFFQALIARAHNGEIVEYDREYNKTNGVVYWIHYTLTPVYEDNVISGVCITGRDVTASKIYLQKIEEQNKTLRDISWMQSHLVRAPLARIMGLTTLLIKEHDSEDKAELLSYLSLSCQELDDIIKEITVNSHRNIEKNPQGVLSGSGSETYELSVKEEVSRS